MNLVKTCAMLLLCVTAEVRLPAQILTTLVQLGGPYVEVPTSEMIQGLDGNLYGTIQNHGNITTVCEGCGSIFRLSLDGTLTTLYAFSGYDGFFPVGGLIQQPNGDLYGTTCESESGSGTVFAITLEGALTTLHTFSGPDGACPNGTLVRGNDGEFYGTTQTGGTGGFGTVFKMSVSGVLTTLHSFDDTDGYLVSAGLIESADGTFYGTAEIGGTYNVGTLFKISSEGTFTVLYNFGTSSGPSNGEDPEGTLLQVESGNFIGTTSGGGSEGGGTVFQISPSGSSFVLLHNFPSGYSSGPGSGVIQATDGNYYGSVEGGDMAYNDQYGKIFELTPAGVLTYLVVFNVTDGATPAAALLQATNGEFYGSTAGDVYGGATLFSLATGLGPFVKTLTGAGAAGSVVQILGTALTGATGVSFNGTAAQFRVISASEIAAILPSGATTGKIQVMTPDGTLVSDKKFRVLP